MTPLLWWVFGVVSYFMINTGIGMWAYADDQDIEGFWFCFFIGIPAVIIIGFIGGINNLLEYMFPRPIKPEKELPPAKYYDELES